MTSDASTDPSTVESGDLRLVQLTDGNSAFSQAARFTMGEPAYADIAFGKWSRVLDGQVGRGHYAFVIDEDDQIRGFAGWALTDEVKAEAWADGRDPLEDADCRAGDCIIFNAWIAKDYAVHRFMVREIRRFLVGRKTAYFNRAYPDGRKRIVRLPINEMVEAHVAALANALADDTPTSSKSAETPWPRIPSPISPTIPTTRARFGRYLRMPRMATR